MGARTRRERRRRIIIGAGVGVAAFGGLFVIALFSDCEICEAANQIMLQGTVADKCAISVTEMSGSRNLPIDSTGVQRVSVGTVTQNCNKKVGYTLSITSQNCAGQPTGAKLVNPAFNDRLSYSAEFNNPATGGSQTTVTGLLQQACSGQFGRDVSNAKITDEISTIYVNYTGDTGLTAGSYQDTLTITMNVK